MNTKFCPVCNLYLPLVEFHKNKSTKSGYAAYCKTCANSLKRKNAQKLKGESSQKEKEDYRLNNPFKTCSKCGVTKAATLEFFIKDTRGIDGLMSYCKVCRRQVKKQWYLDNPDKMREMKKQSHIRNREHNSARHAKWQKDNWEKVYPRIHAHVHKRRALKELNGGTYTKEEVDNQRDIQNGCCYYCGVKPKGKLHIDHFIPLTKGGTNYITNIVLACRTCNSSKGAKLPQEWNPNLPTSKP